MSTNEPVTGIISSKQEKVQSLELGFIEKLVELWRVIRIIIIVEAKSETIISVLGILAKYTYRAGEAIMNKTMDYRSTCMANLFIARNKGFVC